MVHCKISNTHTHKDNNEEIEGEKDIRHIENKYQDGGDLVAKSCLTLATPGIVACQASLSMGFSRQDYWSGFLLQGIFQTRNQTWVSCFTGRFFTDRAMREAQISRQQI